MTTPATVKFANDRTILLCLMVGPLLAGVGIWQEHGQDSSQSTVGTTPALAAALPNGTATRRAELRALRQELRKLESENLDLRSAYTIPAQLPDGLREGDCIDVAISTEFDTVPRPLVSGVQVVALRERPPQQVALALTDEQARTLELARGAFTLVLRDPAGAPGELFAEARPE